MEGVIKVNSMIFVLSDISSIYSEGAEIVVVYNKNCNREFETIYCDSNEEAQYKVKQVYNLIESQMKIPCLELEYGVL